MTNLLLSAGFNFSDYKAYIILAVLVAALIIWKVISSKFKKSEPATSVAVIGEASEENTVVNTEELKSSEPVYTGYVTLEGLSEQDAATIMAITSHKTGIPVERLGFCSIRLKSPELINVSEQDAAAVMAITSHKTGIPLENLYFKSIKLLED
ncbi:MAG: hypothetical protein IKK46_00665 [Clostridia bacterium]|nr:hypothetical protein [Clostridia bacterium]